jgi:propionyl-CoA carboxylase beta chain
MGPCAGGAVYSPAITDFVFMVKQTSYMFVTGPSVVERVTHEKVTSEELGGATVHGERSGAAHVVCDDEYECLSQIRTLLEYLPDNNMEEPSLHLSDDPADRRIEDIAALVPDDPAKPYDMLSVIRNIVDGGVFFEIHGEFAKNILCGFARMGGRSVGFVANQPAVLAGVLDIDASRKAARFVRFCDAFNIPLVTLVDVPGFLPGTDQEWRGIIVNGAKLLYAFCEATVPRVTVITRKAYGGAYDVMNSKHIRADLNYAWPSAEIAVMGPKGAAEIIFRRDIESSPDPSGLLSAKEKEYREKFANPYLAAGRGYIDEVIDPRDTRQRIIGALDILDNKVAANPKKKHGNIPL